MMDSKELQGKAHSLLTPTGPESNNVNAVRGVGMALLALLQFLRESEQKLINAPHDDNDVDWFAIYQSTLADCGDECKCERTVK